MYFQEIRGIFRTVIQQNAYEQLIVRCYLNYGSQQNLPVQSQQHKLWKKVRSLFKFNKKDIRTSNWRRSGVFIINFEHISQLLLVFLLLTLSR